MFSVIYILFIKNSKGKKTKQTLNSEINVHEVGPIIDVKNESFFCYILTL